MASNENSPEELSPRGYSIRRFAAFHTILFLLNILLFAFLLSLRLREDFNSPVLYTPAAAASRFEKKFLDFNLYRNDPFKGAPSPAVDAAWDGLFANAFIRLTPSEMKRLGRTSTPIQDGSGDFLGALDVYHQLHCISYIYQYVHPEYYKMNETNIPIPDYVDHCIDMLRQVAMCRADTAVVTHTYHPHHPIAWPEFSFEHECRNWDEVNAWAGTKDRVVNQSDPMKFRQMVKNPNYVGGIFDGHDGNRLLAKY